MDTNVVLLNNEDLEALDETGPHTVALRRGLDTLLQNGVLVTEQPTSATDPRMLTVVGKLEDRHGGLVLGEAALDLVLVDVVERVVERLTGLEFNLAERTFEEHLVEPGEEVDAPAAD